MTVELEKKLGGELDLEIKLEGAFAVISITHEGNLGSVKVEGKVNAALLVDKITDMIPGEWDDDLLDSLAVRLLSKKSV